MQSTTRSGSVWGPLVLAALAAACASTDGTSDTVENAQWLEPSPLLEQQIADEAQRLPWTHGIEHLEQIRWFASVGEPAYPVLLGLAADPRDHVSAAALAALGATADPRLVPQVQALQWGPGRGEELQLERSRTLVRLGDWSAMPPLIAGLTHERVRIRALCDQALYEATRLRFDYDPRADETEREKSIRRWEEWWLARTGEGLLLTDN